jgi:hypothetical protein
MRPFVRSCCHLLVSTALVFFLSGCSGPVRNTLAQDLAWERWHQCSAKYPTIQLKEIRQDGQIWLWHYGGSDWAAVQECLRVAAAEQAKRGTTATANVTSVGGPSSTDTWATPQWKPGYEWAYRWQSPRGSGTFVWSVDRIEVLDGTRYYVVKSGTREIYWRAIDLAYHMDKVDGNIEVRRTMDYRLPWPVRPGTSWEIKTTEERPKIRQTNDLVYACRAESEELVSVPAGQFQTVKVICQNARTARTAYETWYAPSVKHWVRERTWFDYGIRERELIAYRLE